MQAGGNGGRTDDGGEVSAVVDPSVGAVQLQLTVWEQWL